MEQSLYPKPKASTNRVTVGSALVAAVALASFSTTPVAAQERRVIEEITVTGTRIKSPGSTSNSPILSVGAEELQFRQPVSIEEVIKTLPQAAPAIGPGTNNGNGGNATIDLRGMGPQRTLVLLDGRRLVPGDLNAQVDTNVIPIALLERIDLVTGGASAVYGADAVTGVVNFITKRNFEGVDVSGFWGSSEEKDGDRFRVDVVMGANSSDGRGNVTLHVGKTKMDPVLQGDRKLGSASLSSISGNPEGSSAGVPVATGVLTVGLPLAAGLGQIDPVTGSFVPLYSTFNFNPLNYYQTPLERTQITGSGRYELSENMELYGQAMFNRTDVTPNLAPSGTFFNNYAIPIGNPFIPEPARQQICAAQGIALDACVAGNTQEVVMQARRRFVELGPRINQHENDMFQYTLGARGDITGPWSYDVSFTHGEFDQVRTQANWGSFSKVQQALRAVNPTTCINPANGCVPLNVFGAAGSITPEMLAFINLDAIARRQIEQDVVEGSISGDLGDFKSPWSNYPIGVAFGAEYRKVQAANKSDSASQIGGEVLGTGAPTPDRSGEIKFTEGYVETIIPIINERTMIHSLSLEGGYRYTRFELDGSETYGSWKYGGEWAPIAELRFRAMQQRATRAPNVNELFAPLVTGLSNLAADPCQGAAINQAEANTPGTLSNLCLRTGAPLAAIGGIPAPAAGQINQTAGGNPLLGPEEADTTTVGFVWEPSFVNNLMMSFDYYLIKLDGAVSNPSTTDILDDCFSTARNPSRAYVAACDQIRRSPISGDMNARDALGVLTPLSNLGTLETDGFDLSVNYRFALADLGFDSQWGSIAIAFDGNHVRNSKFQATPNSINRDCASYYSIACGNPTPRYSFIQRTTWTFGEYDLSYQWRFMSSTNEEGRTSRFKEDFAKIDAYNYVDLAAAWQATEQIRASLTVANLFDKGAPNVGNSIGSTTTNSGNTFPQVYDAIGRSYTLGIRVSL